MGRTASNDAYAWTGGYNVDRSYGVNGLNQLTSAGATALGYDGRGNLTQSGGLGYGYTVDNQLATTPGGNLAYDPLGRLFNVNAENGVNTTLLYDGADVIAEIDQASGALLRRYVQGPGSDEPLIWYEGSGTGDRRWLHADERGSIVAVTNDAGNAIAVNSYDEFGIPGANNIGRFQYTGQKWLPSVGLYDYKARMYSPTLGRFMQTDPIGYGDGPNMYNYVGSDPVNSTDPTGLSCKGRSTDCDPEPPPGTDIIVNGRRDLGWYRELPSATGLVPSILPTLAAAPTAAPANATQRVNPPKPCRPTNNQLANSGRVTFRFAEGSATLIATSGDAWGTFRTTGGYSGTFHVSFDGGMVGVRGFGTAYGRGSSQSLATFQGVNYNLIATLGPYSSSDNFDPNTGEHVGQTDAGSTLGLGLGITRSNTEILTISCPR